MNLQVIGLIHGAYKFIFIRNRVSKIKISDSLPSFNSKTGTFGDDLIEQEISDATGLNGKLIAISEGMGDMGNPYDNVLILPTSTYLSSENSDDRSVAFVPTGYYRAYIKEPEQWRKWNNSLF